MTSKLYFRNKIFYMQNNVKLNFICDYGILKLNFGDANKKRRQIMFLERTERLALVDFENKHINYIDLINNIKYFSEYVVELEKEKFGLIVMENRPEWIYSFFCSMG